MVKQLLSTKLKMPHLTPHYLRRPRLSSRLEQLATKKLTLIEGAAGSGKSMLIADYFRQANQSVEVVWLNLTADCQDPALFWSYVMEGLKPFFKLAAEQELAFVQSQFTALEISELLTFMLNQLTDSAFYFVIDDCHLLKDEELLRDLEFFIGELPSTAHVILLSRGPLSFYLAKWQLEQQVLIIRQKELDLTRTEALAFMAQSSQKVLTLAVQERYWQFSEGWIGGLQLLLAEEFQASQHQLAEPADKQLVYDYLRRELYYQLSPELQEFLVVTSQFSYFNESLCRVLFPQKSFATWLGQLEEHHIMVQIVSFKQQAYRYHHLFEEFFLQESRKLDARQLLEIRDLGLAVFLEQGDLEEGIKLALELKEYQRVMPLILELEQPLKLFFYMKQVPNVAMRTNFDFTLQKFFFHYMNMDIQECLEIYDLAAEQSKSDDQFSLFKGMEYLIGEQLVVFEIPVLSNKMIQELNASEVTKALMTIRNVSVLFYQCRYREGLEQVAYNKELSHQLNSDYLRFFNLNIEAQLLEEIGELNQSLAVYRKIKLLLTQSKSLNQLSTSFQLSYHISILGTHLKRIDLASADEEFTAIEKTSATTLYVEALVYNQIEYWYLAGQPKKAWSNLQQLIQSPTFSSLLPIASLLKYAFSARQLPKQLKERFKEQAAASPVVNFNVSLLLAQILYEEGEVAQALAIVNQVLVTSRKEKIPLKIIEGNLLKIKLLIDEAKHQKETRNLYREAVYYGSDNHALQAFFFEQETLKKLFQDNYQLIEASLMGAELSFHQKLVSLWRLKVTNPLTEREVGVLVEIANSLTNKEIAKKLFISEATVKTHILNVYRKLAVNSRVAAVEKGQQLEIL